MKTSIKKLFGVLLVLIIALISCENDDFCSEETTPELIISFHDATDPDSKKELPLYVWAKDKDSLYELKIVDSILIPLNTANTNVEYLISTTNIVDNIKLSYIVEDVFVSESCGFKSIFKNLTLQENSTNWIQSVEITNAVIENETNAHVKIYH